MSDNATRSANQRRTKQPRHPSLRSRIDGMGISSLLRIVGVSLTVVGAIILLAAILVVGWFQHAAADREQWVETESHLHHIDDIATERFLAAFTNGEPMPTAEGIELISHIDMLVTSAQEIASTEGIAESGAQLTAAGQRFANAANGTSWLTSDPSLAQLRQTYGDLHQALDNFALVLGTGHSEKLAEQTNRASTARIVLLVGFTLGAAVMASGGKLSKRIRRREETLLTELSDEQRLLQTIIDALPESIVWKDINQNMLGCNAALRRRFEVNNMAPDEGGLISDCAMKEDIAEYVAAVEALEREVMRSGIPVIGRRLARPEADGSESVVLRTAIPLRHDDEVVGVLSTTQDITTHTQMERSLASAGRLESIGQLSAGVAHEINTPVQFVSDNTAFLDTSLTTLVEVIERLSELASAHDPEATELVKKEADLDFLLEDIPDAVSQSLEGLGQIAQIVQAMKAFAHPGGEIRPTSLNQLITSTVDVSRNEWKYNATIDLNLDEDLADLPCDEGQIKQVTLNMIVNAAHAIADGGDEKGVISITTGANERYQTIQISDTGTGIPEEVQKRMFERFYTTKETGRGSGQGLAIAYDAVSAHGGEITVESTVGEGTTFTIHLPIQPPQNTDDDEAPS